VTHCRARVTEVSTVVLEDEIDSAALLALQRQVSDALRVGQRRVVVDLRAVTVPGAQTVSLLCAVLRRLNLRGARLAIVGAPASIGRVLELCATDGLELYPSAGAALSPANLAAQPAAVA
jgi:anti-anti-sigma factor